jgi:hypothetical protein
LASGESPKKKPAVPERMQRAALSLAETLGQACPPGVGFALLMFEVKAGGWVTYVSNANREEMIRVLAEFLAALRAEREGS